MELIDNSTWQRAWTHNEMPGGKPSAAARRLGCKCEECRQLQIAYMKEYRKSKVPTIDNEDGTTFYHSHKGQPSATTARTWGCIHPRCLKLAGLYLDGEVVRLRSDDTAADEFGTPKP